MEIIRTANIVKRYGDITAVAGIDLKIDAGECFGLLGPNGAGKTTLVKMITAVSPVTSGSAQVAGFDVSHYPRQTKSLLGVVPQEDNLDPDLSVLKNLMVFARYFDIPSREAKKRALENLELFGLSGRQDSRIQELSGGMKRRLLIARALINKPQIIVLDEPTVGLDPQTKHMVWQKLGSLKQQDTTLLLTTQNMEEAAWLCDRLAIINEGKIVALGNPGDLIADHGSREIVEARVLHSDRDSVKHELESRTIYWQELGDTLYIFNPVENGLPAELISRLTVISRRMPTLEDVFLRLTGRSLEE